MLKAPTFLHWTMWVNMFLTFRVKRTRRSRLMRVATGVVVIVLLAGMVRWPALAMTKTVITVGQLGTPGDLASTGARPSMNFYLPVFRSVRSVRFRAVINVSSAVDANSTLTLSSGGVPRWSISVGDLRKHPKIDVPLALPVLPSHTIDVSLLGAFAHVHDDICSRYDPASLFMVIKQGAGFVIDSDSEPSSISGFLERFDGDLAVVVPPGTSIQQAAAMTKEKNVEITAKK